MQIYMSPVQGNAPSHNLRLQLECTMDGKENYRLEWYQGAFKVRHSVSIGIT